MHPLDIPVEADETEEVEHGVKDEDRWDHPRYDGQRAHADGVARLFCELYYEVLKRFPLA